MASNAIEGKYLNYDSVRSSVRKRLDKSFHLGDDTSTHHTDALTSLLIDSNLNHKPLTLERLHKWHIQTLRASVDLGLKKVEIVTQKAKFYNNINQEKLNSRQIKVLNKLLEYYKD